MALLEMTFVGGAQRGETCYGCNGLASPGFINPHSGLAMKHENIPKASLRAEKVWGRLAGSNGLRRGLVQRRDIPLN